MSLVKVRLNDGVCVVEPQGPLDEEIFAAIARTVDPEIEAEGHLDALIIHTREFPGWEDVGSVIEHFKFVRDHQRKIQKVALVTDAGIAETVSSIVDHFVKAEVEVFDFDDLDDALEWAREGSDADDD